MKKKRQSKVVRVELRARGGLHGPEKPEWSAGDMVKQPKNEEQQQNEEHQQMKIHIKNEQEHKNLTGGSPKQSNTAGSF